MEWLLPSVQESLGNGSLTSDCLPHHPTHLAKVNLNCMGILDMNAVQDATEGLIIKALEP